MLDRHAAYDPLYRALPICTFTDSAPYACTGRILRVRAKQGWCIPHEKASKIKEHKVPTIPAYTYYSPYVSEIPMSEIPMQTCSSFRNPRNSLLQALAIALAFHALSCPRGLRFSLFAASLFRRLEKSRI